MKRTAIQKLLLFCFVLCVVVFVLQQTFLNMKVQTAQARYFFPMLWAVGVPAILLIKDKLGKHGLYEKAVAAAVGLSIIHHGVWLFVFITSVV